MGHGYILCAMFGGNWRTHLAIGGIIAAFVAVMALIQASYDQEPEHKNGRATQNQPQFADPASGSDPDQYVRLCDQANTPEEHDLCQQWRMAEAANNQLKWAERQFFATALEIAALVATVVFTGMAALAASKAAGATRASIELTKNQMRARVGVDNASVQGLSSTRPIIKIVLKNYGQTPATNFRFRYVITIQPLAAAAPKIAEAFRDGPDIDAGRTFQQTFFEEDWDDRWGGPVARRVLQRDIVLQIAGEVAYTTLGEKRYLKMWFHHDPTIAELSDNPLTIDYAKGD